MDFKSFLASFKPHPLQTSSAEKIRSGFAGGIAILLLVLALQILPQGVHPLFIAASMAASAVLLYATPHSPLSQPWNLLGGHLVSGLAGFICCLLIPEPALAAGTAVGLSILIMQFLSCLHPPGAATALMIVISSTQFNNMGWQSTITLVVANAGIALLLALTINNILPGRHYPMRVMSTPNPPKPTPFMALEQTDIQWALEQIDSMIDVSEEDLAEIYKLAVQKAQARIGKP